MKCLWVLLFTTSAGLAAMSQTPRPLAQRLEAFMQANKRLDFDTVIAYTYPKLFTLAPRDEVLESLKNGFDNDQFLLSLDSLKTDSIFPVFSVQGGSYAKVRYAMNIKMHFKNKPADSTLTEAAQKDLLAALTTVYGTTQILVQPNGDISMQLNASMLAAKDRYAKEWCFMDLKAGDATLKQLFPKELLDKLASFH